MIIKRVTIFLLTVLILFADCGQTIYAHTCLVTKHTHFSLGEPKHCCLENNKTSCNSFKKSSCCEVNSKYLKQNFIAPSSATIKFQLAPLVVSSSKIFVALSEIISVEGLANTSPSFLLSKSSLAFTQTFRI